MKQEPYIILADDDEDDRSLFEEVMTTINAMILVVTVEDGSHLLEKISQDKISPDMIFLDLNMPCINGHECLINIRSKRKFDETPVIIYSTSSWENDLEKTYKNGANLYIKKPNAFTRLELLLRRVIAINWLDHFPRPARHLFYME